MKRVADSGFTRATDLGGNRGGDPASQFMEDIVKVVHVDVDTFSRAEVQVESAPCCFQSSVCA